VPGAKAGGFPGIGDHGPNRIQTANPQLFNTIIAFVKGA
jgi:hypothetical protein